MFIDLILIFFFSSRSWNKLKLCPTSRFDVMSLLVDCILQASNHKTHVGSWQNTGYTCLRSAQSTRSDITSHLKVRQSLDKFCTALWFVWQLCCDISFSVRYVIQLWYFIFQIHVCNSICSLYKSIWKTEVWNWTPKFGHRSFVAMDLNHSYTVM